MRQLVDQPEVAVVMGVSGTGKTTIGLRLAKRLGWKFEEGDSLHPPENVAKMKSGHPLDDADREPWLTAVAEVIDGWRSRGERGVITCSALKQTYRRQIIGDRRGVRLVYLEGSRELIAGRLATRKSTLCLPICSRASLQPWSRPGAMRTRSQSASISRLN
jgi:gluconokinase